MEIRSIKRRLAGWALVKMGTWMDGAATTFATLALACLAGFREQRMDAARSPALAYGEVPLLTGVVLCHLLREAEPVGLCSTSAIISWAIHTDHPSRRTAGRSLCLGAAIACFDCDGPFNATSPLALGPLLPRHWRMASDGPSQSRVLALISGGCKNLQMWISVETCLGRLLPWLTMSDSDVIAVTKAKKNTLLTALLWLASVSWCHCPSLATFDTGGKTTWSGSGP